MRKIFIPYIALMLVLSWAVPQTNAASVAEASTGKTALTVGTYDLSSMTEEEKEWFTTFLKGNFFTDGWEQIATDILTNTKLDEREQQKHRLHALGFKIGSEWCRANELRKITTDNLRKWGKALKNTAEDAPHLLTEVIQQINTEVDTLLN